MAIDYNRAVTQITDLRVQKDTLNANLLAEKQQLIENKYLLEEALNKNQSGTVYQQRILQIQNNITAIKNSLASNRASELALVNDLSNTYGGFDKLVDQMDDRYPILFFPVRIETVFNDNPRQLWIRIFPDEIAVDTHEINLTESEVEEGKMYYRQFVKAENDEEKIQAWDLLCRSFGAERAAWVALQMKPSNIDSNPEPENLIFPELEAKPDSWSKQPCSNVMPDSFVVYASSFDGSIITHKMNAIPDELKMGIDPALDPDEEAMSFDQQTINGLENELVADEQVDWMLDFNAAVAKGMAAKINLTASQYTNGFNRITVLGVKSTLTPEQSQQRLENLLNSQHYTNGLSLLKQGTNTNNTESDYSGFSSVEFGNKTTYQTERLNPLFTPTPYNRDKTDGQILCEALGIEYETLSHIFQSSGKDISNSMLFNSIMFQGIFGYTANELLNIFGNRHMVNNNLRRFFTDYIRSRGALPSIRCGNQPYGILPTSVFSRLNWTNDPDRELLMYILRYSNILDNTWTDVLRRQPISMRPGQKLSNVLSKNALSTEYVQRIGVGAGYVWNNIEYAALEFPHKRQQWAQEQLSRMEQVRGELNLPVELDNKALQINYLEKQSNQEMDLTYKEFNENEPMPVWSSVGNMFHLLATASFDQLRDEDFKEYGVPDEEKDRFTKNLLYRYSRQSIMLEYYEAACEILQIPLEKRRENEFINIVNQEPRPSGNPMGTLSTGESRLQIMNRPFRQGAEESISLALSRRPHDFPEAQHLIEARDTLLRMADVPIKELNLLLNESIDTVSYRMDVWRLSLVNQRLNALRNIKDGSLNRIKGIYLGAYGWVENIKKQTVLVPATPPTADNQFPENLVQDKNNKGFIHAPSLNQATTGAVMLSGYSQRAESTTDEPLSVNISSQRVRTALDIMDGIRNGQNLGVLLGYEFERKFRELYPQPDINLYVYNLRKEYPLDKFVVEVAPDPASIDKITARNVVNGNRMIELLKEDKINEIITKSGAPTTVIPHLRQAIDWIWNLTDAIADINTTEGIFQVVQGNTIKGGAITNAISKGRFQPEPDFLASSKEGLNIPQRFTMHLDTATPNSVLNGWSVIAGADFRQKAEPYINKWLSSILPDPAKIICQVKISDTATQYWVTAKEIKLNPIDLMYLIQEDLIDGDDQLSLIIKQYVRKTKSLSRESLLLIDYEKVNSTADYSFAEVHPILFYAKKLFNGSRHLNTHDYMLPNEVEGIIKIYNISDLSTRYNNAKNALTAAKNTLQTALNASVFSKTNVVNALFKLSFFGIEQTIYEFMGDTHPDDETALKETGNQVLQQALDKLSKATISTTVPSLDEDPTKYVTEVLEAFKQIMDSNTVVLPLFQVRTEEQAYLSLMFNHSSTLKNDHLDNDLLTEEWMTSIAKVRPNAANFELLSILTTTLNASHASQKPIIPLQLPYSSDGTERWLGASVKNNESLKENRVALGASVPNGHLISGDQVGIMVDEWMDVVPFDQHNTGISFHYNQPNSRAPQCLILGLTPQIRGKWKWSELIEMLEETFDLAKKRGIDYEEIAPTAIGQLPGLIIPFTHSGNAIGLSGEDVLIR